MARRELRLALAMRGGVSLAIWIGGACAEIDALRRAVGPPPDVESPTTPSGLAFWDRVGEVSGYDDVVVDVMAGASAGGLNGVLYAASLTRGFAMDDLREVWAELGDTDKLLRRRATDTTWPSLFRGDGYFYARLEEQLRRLAGDGSHAPAVPPRLDLRLSATFVDPVRRPGRSPSDEELVERRFSSGFRVTSPAYPWLSGGLPRAAAGADSPQSWSSLLAMAARSTSSFPGAFEAATITSSRPQRFGEHVAVGAGSRLDMHGVLLDSGAPDEGVRSFAVSDGGVLDNIPLGRALDAVAEAPAGRPTDRYLLYLQPGVPSVPKPWTSRPDSRRETAFSVLRGALSSRMPAEDIIGDLEQLDRYNAAVEQAASLRRSTLASVDGLDALLQAAARTWDSYRVLRAEEDRRSVQGLLDDPVVTLGEDPFPQTVAGRAVPDSCWRSPLDHTGVRPWSGADLPDRDRLAAALHDEFMGRFPAGWAGEDDGEPVWRAGVRPVLRVTQLLIEWAQHLEGRGAVEAGPCKAELYRVATFVRAGLDRPRQLGWVTVAATHAAAGRGSGTERALVRTTLRGLAPLVRLPSEEVAAIVDALHEDRPEALADLLAARVRALDGLADGWDVRADVPGDAASSPDGQGPVTEDVRAAVVLRLLVPVARRLAALSRGLGGAADTDPGTEPDREPAWYLDRALVGPGTAEITAGHLAALEVVGFLEFATGLPARRRVRLMRISSASETPMASHFDALLDVAEQQDKWWDPHHTDRSSQRGIHVGLKLAGDEAANFSAFLDERWRLNDWMWGRLDAVPTLLELLVTPASLRSWLSGRSDWLAAVEELVLGPADADDDGLRAFLAEHVWTVPTREAVAAELDALRSGEVSGGDSGSVAVTRRALVAARQWQVLADEAAVTEGRDTRSDPDWPGRSLLEAVRRYDVGAETFGHPRVREAVAGRLRAIVWVAGRVASYNIVEHVPRDDDDQVPRKARRWANRARIALQASSAVLVPRMIRAGRRSS